MFAAQWVPYSSEFLFSSMFVERFSYLANNFYVTVSAIGSSFSPGLREVHGEINFSNTFANTMFTSGVHKCIHSFRQPFKSVLMIKNGPYWKHRPQFAHGWQHTVWKHAVVLVAHCLCISFITNKADTFPLTLPMLPNVECSSHFFELLLFCKQFHKMFELVMQKSIDTSDTSDTRIILEVSILKFTYSLVLSVFFSNL